MCRLAILTCSCPMSIVACLHQSGTCRLIITGPQAPRGILRVVLAWFSLLHRVMSRVRASPLGVLSRPVYSFDAKPLPVLVEPCGLALICTFHVPELASHRPPLDNQWLTASFLANCQCSARSTPPQVASLRLRHALTAYVFRSESGRERERERETERERGWVLEKWSDKEGES